MTERGVGVGVDDRAAGGGGVMTEGGVMTDQGDDDRAGWVGGVGG